MNLRLAGGAKRLEVPMGIKSAFAAVMVAGMAAMSGNDVVVTDVYSLTLNLRVPQVLDNSSSTGRRMYKVQRLSGELYVSYVDDGTVDISVEGLVNNSFKVGGANVRYQVTTDVRSWNLIGSNKTGIFKKPSICLDIEAFPSYVWSWEPDSDNSFILTLAGYGVSYKYIHGYVAGTQGCGCTAYGHKSPTRRMGPYGKPTPLVVDVAATYGTFKLKLKRTIVGGCDSP